MDLVREHKSKANDNKNPITKSIELKNNIILSRQTCSHMAFVGDYISSGFRIETSGGKVIYIDPYKLTEVKPADYIFITHAHPDHLSMPDIEKIAKKDTVVICPKNAANKLKGYTIKEVKPEDVFRLEDIQCKAVAAYYTRPLFLFVKSHPKTDMNVGYIININGNRLYHMGDTHLIPEMKTIRDIDVVMVPIGVGTMNREEAADVVNMINPLVAIPMHYALGKADLQYLKRACKPDIKIETLDE